MKITVATVKALSPCKDRFDNFVTNNPNFDGTAEEFLSLDNIAYSDKVWVMCRLMTKPQAVKWGVACADSVLHIFEANHPEDKSVTNLLNYLKSGLDFENLTQQQTKTISILRKDAWAAYSAATAAAYAATYAAYAATYAAAATAAAYAAYAAYAATYAATHAGKRQDQEKLNLSLLVIALKS